MKKILALLLSVAMVLCMMPGMAFAEDPTDSFTVTLKNPPAEGYYVWDGQTKNPEVTVKRDDTSDALTKGTDYEVSYKNNINPGIATVTVTGKGNYEGRTATTTFRIKKSLAAVSLETPATVVEGTEITLDAIKLTDNGSKLTAGTDYGFADAQNTVITKAHRTVKIVAEESSNYFGEKTVTFAIGESIETATVTVSPLTYNGNEQTAIPTVTLNGKTLRKDVDYRVTNNKATNADTYQMTITGIGGYAKSKEASFKIAPKDLKYVTVPAIDNQKPNAVPSPVIADGTKTLVQGVDYEVSYANNDQVGNTATLTITGMKNYTGTVTRNYLIKDEINDAQVFYTKTSYDYTGYGITPEIQVKSLDPKKTYILNRDYKIVGGGKIDAGVYTFSLVGIGNYGGEFFTGTYVINRLSLATSGRAALSGETYTYTGKAIEPAVTVTCGGRALRKDVDYTVTYLNNNRIGTASVIVYGKGNYSGSLTKTFRIVGKDLSQLTGTLDKTSYNYDGLEKKPAVTLYDGTKKLTNGVDYTVSYRNNKNAGTGEAIVTGKGNYGGTRTLTFRIVGKSQTVTTRYTRYSKTLSSKSFNLLAAHDGDGTLVYQSDNSAVAKVSADGTVTVVGTGIAKITVSTTGNVKYDPASKVVYITVKPAKPTAKLTTPAKKQIKVTFTKVKGATKYQVRYGRMGKYYSKYVTHRDNDYTKTYTTINNRISGKTYYIKVRAYKELEDGTRIYGDWSPVQIIKAK